MYRFLSYYYVPIIDLYYVTHLNVTASRSTGGIISRYMVYGAVFQVIF